MSIQQIITESGDFRSFARSYGRYISQLLQNLDMNSMESFLHEIEQAREHKNTVFVIGNGGSAATASHIANDLGCGLGRHIEPSLKLVSLTDNLPVITAIANDAGYEQIFLRQLQLCFCPGDKLIVISASGNSPNLLLAADWVRQQGGKVLGLLGFDGGKLKEMCDAAVIVVTPKGEYGPVEDVHMILDHLLFTWLYSKGRK